MPQFDGIVSKEARRCSTRPLAVAGGFRFLSLSAGPNYTCGIATDSLAYCWGSNAAGELGVPELLERCTRRLTVECSRAPMAVSGGHHFVAVSAASSTTCALTGDGALYCWGMVGDRPSPSAIWAHGQCQRTEMATQPDVTGFMCTREPTQVDAGFPLVQLAMPYMLDSDGAIFVLWGHVAQLRGLDDSTQVTPLAKLAAGAPCGLDADQRVYCWRIVNQSLLDQPPGIASGPDGFHTVAADRQFIAVGGTLLGTCALSAGGAVSCFSGNSDAKKGRPRDPCWEVDAPVPCDKALTPHDPSVPAFRSFAAGFFHLCALTADGDAYCWGGNRGGQLGTGDRKSRTSPTRVIVLAVP